MGRRSFISMSAISRWAATARANEARMERENLINQQRGTAKELTPEYSLDNVDFNDTTRVTKVTFKCTKRYRTIERYVTQNYQRFPIYSDWKIKTNYITKTIKLTNSALESLNFCNEELIRKFADQIILRLNDPELIPSWLTKNILKNELDLNVKEQKSIKKNYEDTFKNKKSEYDSKIEKIKITLTGLNIKRLKTNQKLSKIEKKISKIETHKKSVVLSIFTLFLYNLYNSNKRYKKLNAHKIQFQTQLNETLTAINSQNDKIKQIKNDIETEKEELKKHVQIIDETINALQEKYREEISQVQAVNSKYNPNANFVSLKKLIGMDYEKITGCYIIHNKEKDRYYVGQSKDVMKRLKQHFKGTTPANIIFAEDYYSSTLENKDEIFEVKIIPLSTKDELDQTERELIEQYDANGSGYNSTKGNL